MSLWVLDTDTVSLLALHHPGVTAKALSLPVSSVTVAIVSVQEIFMGRYNRIKQAKNPAELIAAYGQLEASTNLLRMLPLLSYDIDAAEHFETLHRTYRRLPTKDLRIAAVALSHHATLVTRNFIDFGQIDGLPIEDWSK